MAGSLCGFRCVVVSCVWFVFGLFAFFCGLLLFFFVGVWFRWVMCSVFLIGCLCLCCALVVVAFWVDLTRCVPVFLLLFDFCRCGLGSRGCVSLLWFSWGFVCFCCCYSVIVFFVGFGGLRCLLFVVLLCWFGCRSVACLSLREFLLVVVEGAGVWWGLLQWCFVNCCCLFVVCWGFCRGWGFVCLVGVFAGGGYCLR